MFISYGIKKWEKFSKTQELTQKLLKKQLAEKPNLDRLVRKVILAV